MNSSWHKTGSLLDINFNSNWTRHSSNSLKILKITCWIAPFSFLKLENSVSYRKTETVRIPLLIF